MKKYIGLMLVACMVLGLTACGGNDNKETSQSTVTSSTESTTESTTQGTTEPVVEKNPYAGGTLTCWASFDYMFNEDGTMKNYLDSNGPIWATMTEWAAENDVTIKYQTGDQNALMAAMAAQQGPDFINTNNAFPSHANMGLVQPMTDDFAEEMMEKYPSMYTELMEYKGKYYGIVHPWASLGSLQYNRTKMENMGIKTPREYWEQGNWTWDTLFEVMKSVSKDTDGDGVVDHKFMGTIGWSERIMPAVQLHEDGTISSTLNTERSREFYQMLHEAYNLETLMMGNPGGIKQTGKVYYMARFRQVEPYSISTLLFEDANGDVIETVPVPKKDKADKEQTQSINYVYFMIPTSCRHIDAVQELIDEIVEAEYRYMADCTEGLRECEYVGVKGSTPETKAYLEGFKKTVSTKNAATYALPEYDPEYIEAINKFYDETGYHMWPNYTKVDWDLTTSKTYNNLFLMPSATSSAELYPKHQAQCDTYNRTYIFN